MFDWNDIRLFLAVAESGSALGAARLLGLNQTTVARRMDVLEHQLGLTLFERRNLGYRLTEDGATLRAAALPMAAQAAAIAAQGEKQRRQLSGTIRVTAPEVIFGYFLAPIVAEFRHQHPEVRIEYDSAESLVDLTKGEADVAIRATEQPHAAGLVALKLSEVAWTAYCNRPYMEMHGAPPGPTQLAGHQIVVYSGQVAQRGGNRWFMEKVDPAQVVGSSSTVTNMSSVLRAGGGVGLLPCFYGDSFGDLVRCFAPAPMLNSTLWILTPEDRRHVPRIDAFVILATERLKARRGDLRGGAATGD